LATDLCRERVARFTCDGRRALSEGARVDFAGVDFTDVEDEDPMWDPSSTVRSEDVPQGCSESPEGCSEVRARAARFVDWIFFARPRAERRVAVVTHQHFLTELQRVLGLSGGKENTPVRFGNAEMRAVELCAESSDEL
jgi:broad specificity phosphatase PhoE